MKNKVLATILFSLLVVPLVQSADNSPRLVVGITVDQLRTDYLEALQHLFGEKGFKRLMREGVVCENLVFDFPNIDKASATATLYTGTTPFFHGIPSERFFNTAFLREEFILNDPSKIGNYTDTNTNGKNAALNCCGIQCQRATNNNNPAKLAK